MARVSRLSLAVLSLLAMWSAACGDDSRPGESASASATDSTVGSATVTPSTGLVPTGSDSGSDTATAGSVSESATGSTGAPTSTVSASESATGSSGATGTSTTGEPAGPCSEDPPPGFMAPFDAACASEPQLGMFDPVVEWHKDTFVSSPGANASASAPIVVQVNDDNMDGKVNAEDMPDILNVISIA